MSKRALVHDLDWLSFKYNGDLTPAALKRLDGGSITFKDGVPVMQRGKIGGEISVVHYPQIDEIRVSGSPHKLLRGESVGAFGTRETGAFIGCVADILGHPVGRLIAAPTSRLDYAHTATMATEAEGYLPFLSPPPKMEEIRPGRGTKVFKNGLAEIICYDKTRKVRARRMAHTIPETWAPGRMLRVELRVKRPSKVFGRTVTVGDVCDPEFFAEAVLHWHQRVESILVSGETWPVPYTANPREMKDALASIGIEATGGLGATIERIDVGAELGIATSRNASRQRTMARDLANSIPRGTKQSLGQEFREKMRDAARESLSTLNADSDWLQSFEATIP